MKKLGVAYQECHHVGTVVHMAVDGRYAGHILILILSSLMQKRPLQN